MGTFDQKTGLYYGEPQTITHFGGKTMKQYNIFISHSWKHNDNDYKKLVEWLDNSDLTWHDFSVPMNDPIHTNGTDKQLYEAISNKIKYSTIILMMGGNASSYSKWIEKEIKIAKSDFSKPLIGISPWGTGQESQVVKKAADEMVGWSSSSVIDAIKKWSN
ncbi:MAG: TIR domain-containing protein [Streptococcaceae bacterium]|jgi:hypothetical protein|nr:TIR domain-containing protein [Streptococcaceae bacterium]